MTIRETTDGGTWRRALIFAAAGGMAAGLLAGQWMFSPSGPAEARAAEATTADAVAGRAPSADGRDGDAAEGRGDGSRSSGGTGGSTQPAEGLYALIDPGWAAASVWDDGKAEVDLYVGKLFREFGLREDAYAVDIVVKETFDPELLVKADDWRAPENFDVLKLNHVTHARTGLYDWDEMVSVFVERDRWVPIKMTYGRQEWCGNVFKEWRRWRDQRWLQVSSYFDGHGTRELEQPLGDEVVPMDSLRLLLRALRFDELEPGREVAFPLLPTLVSVAAGPSGPVSARLTAGAAETVSVPAGSFDARPVSVRYPGPEGDEVVQTYWIESAAPNRIVRIEGPRGEALELERSERLAYWRMSGDEVPWMPAPALPDSD